MTGLYTVADGNNIFAADIDQLVNSLKSFFFNVKDYGATGNGSTDDTTTIQTAINAANTNGGIVFAPPGTYLFSSSISLLSANVSLIGAGVGATVFTTNATNIDGIIIGNTQVTPYSQLNNIVLRDFTIDLPSASTKSCINATGMGEGGEIKNVKAQQGKYGFLLEDIDRCVFTNLEAVNFNTAGIVCRQGYNNTWGTVTFLNCHSVINTASTTCLIFDNDTVTQLSPNKFDRVSFINCHFYANPGTSGSLGMKHSVGATAMKFLNCLWENTLKHVDIESEVDAAWDGCSFINVNFGTTPTTDTWYLNAFCQVSIYDCNVQQSTNLFNGVSGSPRVGLWGISKNGGNIANVFAGSFGAKFGTDTLLAGDNILALGLNNQQMSYVFTHNLQLGVSASTLTSGSGAPSGGSDGDYYFRTDTPGTANQRIYVKSAGSWISLTNFYFNVKDYGATGNGSTDDTTAIKAAITALNVVGGGILFFPPGNYAISDVLTIGSNTAVQGAIDGISIIIQGATNKDCFAAVDVLNVSFRDIYLYGPGSGTGNGINFTRSSNPNLPYLSFANMEVSNFGVDGIALSNPIVSTFSRVLAQTNGRYGINTYGVISGPSGTSLSFDACFANANATAGYRLYNMTYCSLQGCAADSNGIAYLIDTCQGISLQGCGAESNTTNSFKINGGVGITLISCWVYDGHGAQILITGSAAFVTLTEAIENSPNGAATSFIKVDSGCSQITLNSCRNITANSLISTVLGPPAVPGSTTPLINPYGIACTVYIIGGTVTVIAVGGSTTGRVTPATIRVPAGQSITLTYSSAPTWVWMGD